MLTGERVWETPWPDADLSLLERDVVEVVVQVNGKLRDRVQAPASATREELEALARERPNVQAHIDGKQVVKVIVVPSQAGQLRRALNSVTKSLHVSAQTACRSVTPIPPRFGPCSNAIPAGWPPGPPPPWSCSCSPRGTLARSRPAAVAAPPPDAAPSPCAPSASGAARGRRGRRRRGQAPGRLPPADERARRGRAASAPAARRAAPT